MRDNPEYQTVPIAVGGSSDRRGVIATCNYIARQFGVRSAMPTAHAKRLCPDLVVLPSRMEAYREASRAIHDIFKRYTSRIEPLSLDEAYLDVTHSQQYQGSATLIAQEIRADVENEVGITISAGVAPNKFLAKIASDWNKPNGLKVITPFDVKGFVSELEVSKLHGVGKVTEKKLRDKGIRYCRDLLKYNEVELVRYFGKFGKQLYLLARGEDHREVVNSRIRKSISVETTFDADISGLPAWQDQIRGLIPRLKERYDRLEHHYRISSFMVKIKYADFTQHTVERQVNNLDTMQFVDLIGEAFERRDSPCRLLGVGFKLLPLKDGDGFQYPLWPDDLIDIPGPELILDDQAASNHVV